MKKKKPIPVLYYKLNCPYSIKVLKCLKDIEKNIPLKNIESNATAKEELFRVGGKIQVPCLFIDGKPLYESADIIDWLNRNKDSF